MNAHRKVKALFSPLPDTQVPVSNLAFADEDFSACLKQQYLPETLNTEVTDLVCGTSILDKGDFQNFSGLELLPNLTPLTLEQYCYSSGGGVIVTEITCDGVLGNNYAALAHTQLETLVLHGYSHACIN